MTFAQGSVTSKGLELETINVAIDAAIQQRNLSDLVKIRQFIVNMPHDEKLVRKRAQIVLVYSFKLFALVEAQKREEADLPVGKLKIAPRVKDGIVYDSGIESSSIADPEVRHDYEQRLEQNRVLLNEKIVRNEIRRLSDSMITYTKTFFKGYDLYPKEYLTEYINNPTQKDLLTAFWIRLRDEVK